MVCGTKESLTDLERSSIEIKENMKVRFKKASPKEKEQKRYPMATD